MKLSLRSYQQQVVDDVQSQNAIVKMPTGSGKTFVAAEFIRLSLKRVPCKKAIMLVPTLSLVEQQAKALEAWLGPDNPLPVARYSGGQATPMMALHEIMVSTPSAFLGLREAHIRFGWDTFSICVFDEVHHVLKDHPYRHLSKSLQSFLHGRSSDCIQIVGLSASLTYAVKDDQIKKALAGLCGDLGIQKMCSPSEEQLKAGGYQKQNSSVGIVDYNDIPRGVVWTSQRQPHKVHETFMKRIKEGSATEFATEMWDTIELLELDAAKVIKNFRSPLQNISLASWETYAHKLKSFNHQHAELLHMLENWYVALRLLVVTWEEEAALAMIWLKISDSIRSLPTFEPYLSGKIRHVGRLTYCSIQEAQRAQAAVGKARYFRWQVPMHHFCATAHMRVHNHAVLERFERHAEPGHHGQVRHRIGQNNAIDQHE